MAHRNSSCSTQLIAADSEEKPTLFWSSLLKLVLLFQSSADRVRWNRRVFDGDKGLGAERQDCNCRRLPSRLEVSKQLVDLDFIICCVLTDEQRVSGTDSRPTHVVEVLPAVTVPRCADDRRLGRVVDDT